MVFSQGTHARGLPAVRSRDGSTFEDEAPDGLEGALIADSEVIRVQLAASTWPPQKVREVVCPDEGPIDQRV
jgi:hypothetical protein